MGERRFVVELIKPSHYDDDGYVIRGCGRGSREFLALPLRDHRDVAARQALGRHRARVTPRRVPPIIP